MSNRVVWGEMSVFLQTFTKFSNALYFFQTLR